MSEAKEKQKTDERETRLVSYMLPVDLIERIRVLRYRNMIPTILATAIYLLEKGLETAEKEGKQ